MSITADKVYCIYTLRGRLMQYSKNKLMTAIIRIVSNDSLIKSFIGCDESI